MRDPGDWPSCWSAPRSSWACTRRSWWRRRRPASPRCSCADIGKCPPQQSTSLKHRRQSTPAWHKHLLTNSLDSSRGAGGGDDVRHDQATHLKWIEDKYKHISLRRFYFSRFKQSSKVQQEFSENNFESMDWLESILWHLSLSPWILGLWEEQTRVENSEETYILGEVYCCFFPKVYTYIIESLCHQTYVRSPLLFIWLVPSLAKKFTRKVNTQ